MKSIKMDFVRNGDATAIIEKQKTYHVVIDSTVHRQFQMPFSHEEFLDQLARLRYHPTISEELRSKAIKALGQVATEILDLSEEGDEMLQIDLVTNARELWALPFEAALARDGAPLFARRSPAMVLTRRMPQQFAETTPHWPSLPRVLFAYASPQWAGGHKVEYEAHKQALLDALQPWVEPYPVDEGIVGDEASVLKTLPEASLDDIRNACRKARSEGQPYSHVHLLAHGVRHEQPGFSHRTRFDIALRSDDGQSTSPEALVSALLPEHADGTRSEGMPTVVTLAICDGGNAENTIIEVGGLAQELHRAGVPIVIASQLPLTFSGSLTMTRVFYKRWTEGKDVREVLHDTRMALIEDDEAGHDWVSMVAYVRLPEGYNDYVWEISLQSQLAALLIASRYAKNLLEKEIKDPAYFVLVTDRLHKRVEQLEHLLALLKADGQRTRADILRENMGLIGSAYKRLAELLDLRAAAVGTPGAEQWLVESRAALNEARGAYQRGFIHDPSNHWAGGQYLALEVALTGQISNVGHWYACYVAAVAQRDAPDASEEQRIWALGSIAELTLLAPLAPGVTLTDEEGQDALRDLCRRAKKSAALFPLLSPIESTRRQLSHYTSWWTKAKGFFGQRDEDLSKAANRMIDLLA